MKSLVLLSGVIGVSGLIYSAGQYQPANPFPTQREFEIVYKASIEDLPAEAESIKIWMPVASSRDGQKLLRREIRSSAPYKLTRDVEHHNEMAYFDLKKPFPKSLEIEVFYEAEISRALAEQEVVDQNQDHYLKPSELMVITDTVRARTRAAVRGKETLQEKARGIYDSVIGNVIYDKTLPGWGRGDTARVCLLGKGNCTDFHSLFISMAQAAQIPARFKIGLTVPAKGQGVIGGYHCWAEYFEQGKGWGPVDASEAWKHPKQKNAYFGNFDTNKFLVSVGRDITLVPAQAGKPVNILFYPYAEVDGKKWNTVKTEFQFKN